MTIIDLGAHFDVPDYTKSPYGPARASLTQLDAPLPPEIAKALQRLGLVMQHTSSWLSKVLVTSTHKEPRITAFLSAWAYERYWMGDALLALSGAKPSSEAGPHSAGALVASVMANVHGKALVGLQATQRLIDCWILQSLLLDLVDAAPLKAGPDIERIVASLERQASFFFEISEQELKLHASTRKLAKKKLPKERWPLGASNQQSRNLLRMLPNEAKDLIEAQVRALPGLANLRLRDLS